MTREYYSRDVTKFSQEVMEGIEEIDARTRGISLLGGWAVFRLVDPAFAMESQDIDVVVHNTPAWGELEPWLKTKKYDWRFINKRERDNAFIHEFHAQMRVDFFFGNKIDDDIPRKLFNTRWMETIKEFDYEGFVPSLQTVLFDKLDTLPKRRRPTKALKDALDARNLMVHNRAELDPEDIITKDVRKAARIALPHIQALKKEYSDKYSAELDDLIAIFTSPPSG